MNDVAVNYHMLERFGREKAKSEYLQKLKEMSNSENVV